MFLVSWCTTYRAARVKQGQRQEDERGQDDHQGPPVHEDALHRHGPGLAWQVGCALGHSGHAPDAGRRATGVAYRSSLQV